MKGLNSLQTVHSLCLFLALCGSTSIVMANYNVAIRNSLMTSILGRSKRQALTPTPTGVADDYVKPQYQFAYHVVAGKEDDNKADSAAQPAARSETSPFSKFAEFGHAEIRDGDKTTGKYFLQLPDGRLQTVNYYVIGDSGYVANVSYE